MAGHAGTRPAERRTPYLPAALLGNGELLVTLSARGEVERLFWLNRPAFPARAVRSVDRFDRRLDSSVLGLAWPFAAVDPSSPRMTATAAALEHRLAARGGGLLRHEEDIYRGGNCWPLCTLWAALYRRLRGEESAARSVAEWARSRATPLGLLPEQSHSDGTPAWVLPLGWSHAFVVLALRPELRLVAESALDVAASPASRR